MTFARLYEYVNNLGQYPVKLEGLLDAKVAELTSQDELYYIPVELDRNLSLGHIKQYRVPTGIYNHDPKWITEVRYVHDLNTCWKRYVCCKELMHAFDSDAERTNTADKFKQLVEEIEAPLPMAEASPMYDTETRTLWMALAVLCPERIRAHFKEKWDSKEMSDYDVALELRIPEVLVKAIMGPNYEKLIAVLNKLFS